jgi:serine acetyltransferase
MVRTRSIDAGQVIWDATSQVIGRAGIGDTGVVGAGDVTLSSVCVDAAN